MRNGYILLMRTGPLTGDNGLPLMFRSTRDALRALQRYPSWGRFAVEVRQCSVKLKGRNGLPDYIVGKVVANGH